MPCVALSNTRARNAIIKSENSARRATRKATRSASRQSLATRRAALKAQKANQKAALRAQRTAVSAPQSAPVAAQSTIAGTTLKIHHDNASRKKPIRLTRDDLINAESRLGSTIFGPIPEGHRREFFHDQENIWIWHESWNDESTNNHHQLTVRYEVRTSGVYKKISTGNYLKLSGDELENFRRATHAYLYVIKKHLYNQPANA